MKEAVLQFINNEATWSILAAAGFTTAFLQLVKHFLKVSKDWVITVLLMTISVGSAIVESVVQIFPNSKFSLMAQSAMVMGASTPFYRFMVKPIYGTLLDAKAYRLQKKESATVQPVPQKEFDA